MVPRMLRDRNVQLGVAEWGDCRGGGNRDEEALREQTGRRREPANMRRMFRRAWMLFALFAACSREEDSAPTPTPDACTFRGAPEAELAEPPPHTPRWAFRPWISKDISD